MSRVAKRPVEVPATIKVSVSETDISFTNAGKTISLPLIKEVSVSAADGKISFIPSSDENWKFAGTYRALVQNAVIGVTQGFQKTLELVGVGYRAKTTGNVINLTVGYSHPIDFTLPDGIVAETPNQTTIVIKGTDKQKVGQVASEIKAFRMPEPYKGKGIKYQGEQIFRKEAKKK